MRKARFIASLILICFLMSCEKDSHKYRVKYRVEYVGYTIGSYCYYGIRYRVNGYIHTVYAEDLKWGQTWDTVFNSHPLDTLKVVFYYDPECHYYMPCNVVWIYLGDELVCVSSDSAMYVVDK